MLTVSAAAASAVLLLAAPSQPGPWQQLGTTVHSQAGKQMHFFRTATSPKALGVVVTSASTRPIHLHWWSYCEFQSDDEMTDQNEATATGSHRVVVYPPVLSGATLCYVSVVARVAGGKAAGAVFDY